MIIGHIPPIFNKPVYVILHAGVEMYNIKASMIVTWRDRIGTEPNVLGGKPVMKGTRLSVEFIVDLVALGWSDRDGKIDERDYDG